MDEQKNEFDALCFTARSNFGLFRRLINNDFKGNWFVDEVNDALQQFYYDYKAGLRPRLMINTPPQHGKSTAVIDFIAWAVGNDPNIRTIFASYSEDLGWRGNRALQRILEENIYQKIFEPVENKKQLVKNSSMVEFSGGRGYFHNTTVGGSVTGKSLDIAVLDDPTKGRSEANSKTIREKTWDWFTDDFLSRFSKDGALLIIMTRWHVDDLAGRLIQHDPNLKVLKYQAIAEQDEVHRKQGEALFEELKPLDFLLKIKQTMDAKGAIGWASLYQQNPFIAGGEIIRRSWFNLYDIAPYVEYCHIFADTAMKTGTYHDYSVFQCWGYVAGKLYLLDQVRGKWEAPDLKRVATDFYRKHNANNRLRGMIVEDKASGTGLIQELRRDGLAIKGVGRTTDKLTRVLDVVGYIEAGHIHLPKNAVWLNDYLSEMESFTSDDGHEHDDQIDPTVDAINTMLVQQFQSFAFSA